jgi:hypothetical protein
MYSSHRQPKKSNRYRWLIFTPAALLALTTQANAQPEPGLTYTVYDNRTGQNNQYNAAPPLPPITPVVDEGTSPNIEYAWGGGPILGSNVTEDVVVRWTGWLLPPDQQTYYLCAASDDGFKLILDSEVVINDWYDRGGGCGQTADVDFSDGEPKQLLAWYYENGGGAHATLLHYTGVGWLPVPEEWFWTDTPVVTTTSTIAPTTVPETTVPTTTTVPPTSSTTTTTTEPQTTTTTSSSTTTTTTEAPPPATTTTTTVPETTTTLPPTTTIPPSTTVEPSTTTTHSSTTTVRTTVPPTTSVPETTTTPPSTTTTVLSTTTIPETAPPPQVTLNSDTDSSQIAQLLVSLEPDQATEVFAALEVEELDEEQVAALVAAVQNAPTEIREAFEEEVDIYKSGLDTYIPVDSKIPVSQRRTLIAVTAGTVMTAAAGASTRMRR